MYFGVLGSRCNFGNHEPINDIENHEICWDHQENERRWRIEEDEGLSPGALPPQRRGRGRNQGRDEQEPSVKSEGRQSQSPGSQVRKVLCKSGWSQGWLWIWIPVHKKLGYYGTLFSFPSSFLSFLYKKKKKYLLKIFPPWSSSSFPFFPSFLVSSISGSAAIPKL